MPTKSELPEDPLARFREMYEALNAQRSWWRDASPLRFAAISALTCPGPADKVASSIRHVTDNLRAEGGLLGRLSRSLQFIVAAMLLGHGDTARGFLAHVAVDECFERVDGLFNTGEDALLAGEDLGYEHWL